MVLFVYIQEMDYASTFKIYESKVHFAIKYLTSDKTKGVVVYQDQECIWRYIDFCSYIIIEYK